MTQPLGGPATPLEGAPGGLGLGGAGLTASFILPRIFFFFKLHKSLHPALGIADGPPWLT